MPACWFAQFDPGPCDYEGRPRPDRAHLIPKTRMKARHLPKEVIEDPRSWRPACRRHHRRLDHKFYRLTREQIPAETEAFAQEHELVWSLTRDFGEIA